MGVVPFALKPSVPVDMIGLKDENSYATLKEVVVCRRKLLGSTSFVSPLCTPNAASAFGGKFGPQQLLCIRKRIPYGILKKQNSCWVVQYIPCASIFPDVFVVLLVELLHRAALELGHYRVDRMIVHRLDMATSGCVIMARTDAALKDLNRQVRLLGS